MEHQPGIDVLDQHADGSGPRNAIRCFGSVRAEVAGSAVKLSDKQARATAMLVVAGPQGMTAAELLAKLYDTEPDSGPQAVVVLMARLRKKLAPRMISLGGRYAINRDECAVDIWTFDELVASDPAAALEMWDEPFGDLRNNDPVLYAERKRLRKLRQAALVAAGWHVEVEAGEGVLSELLAEVTVRPFDEALCASAAAACYRLGRQVEALQVVNRCRESLAERGLEPSAMVRDIEFAILDHDETLLAARSGKSSVPLGPEPDLPIAFNKPSRPIVGRSDVLDRLRRLFENVAAVGRPTECSVGVLHGDAGLGKTACAATIVHECVAFGARVRVGMADIDTPPYGPILQALPELRPAVDELALADPNAERSLMDRAAAELIQELSDGQPLVIVLDDAHSADTQSLSLLRSLASRTALGRVLILLTCRPGNSNEMWSSTLSYFIETGCTVFELEPLTVADLEELVAIDHPTQRAMVRDQFAHRIHEISEGNGFVASVLSRDAPPDLNTILLPESITAHESLAAHLRRRVSQPLLEDVLTAAALIGRQFSRELAAHVVDKSVEIVGEALQRCEDLGVCRPLDDDMWQFDHLLSVNYFTARVPLLRQGLFARIAQHKLAPIESMPRYVAGAGNTLAPELAFDLLMRSGRQRFDALAFHDALVTFTQALDLVGEVEGDELELRLMLAHCASRCGAIDQARVHRQAAFELAELEDDHDTMSAAAIAGLPSGEFAGGEPDRLQMLRTIDPSKVSEFSPEVLARHLLRQARMCEPSSATSDLIDEADRYLIRGRSGRGRDQVAQVSASSDAPSPDQIALEVERLIATTLSRAPRRVYAELAELADQLAPGALRAEMRQREVAAALIEQEPLATTTILQRAAGEVYSHGSARTRWTMEVIEATLNLTGTRLSSTNIEVARRTGLRLGIPDVHDNWHAQLWMTAWVNNLYKEALDNLDHASDQIADNLGWRTAVALCAAEVDDLPRARREVNLICERLPESIDGPWSLTIAALLAETAHLLGDDEAAEAAVHVLQPHTGRAVLLGAGSAYLGPVDRYLGVAMQVLDPKQAGAFFTSAIESPRCERDDVWTIKARQNLADLQQA